MAFAEFVVVIATIMSLNPLAMDMMLPALPEIGSAFHIDVANRLQMVLSAFLIGFGFGQFVIGPLSDSFGRRPVLLGGMILYCIASGLAIAAPVVAPSFGQAVMLLTQWRGIFVVLMLYGTLALLWSALRLPETLPVSERRPFSVGAMLDAFRRTLTNRQTLGYALATGGSRARCSATCSPRSRCSPASTSSGTISRWRSRRSRRPSRSRDS